MKIGDVFETATCARCGKPIQHTYWGNGGNHWEHEGGSWECSRPMTAKPAEGTIRPVKDAPTGSPEGSR